MTKINYKVGDSVQFRQEIKATNYWVVIKIEAGIAVIKNIDGKVSVPAYFLEKTSEGIRK